MDIVFLMGLITGFFAGIGFTILFTNIICNRVLAVLTGLKKKKKQKNDEDDDDEGSDFWKPKGWRPDIP